MESHTRDDADQMAGETGTFWFDQGQQAAEAKLKQASVLAAAVGLLDALYFYADPESYFAVAILADRPAGAFADDEAALPEDDKGYYADYRGEGGTYPGKKARAALAAWRKATAD